MKTKSQLSILLLVAATPACGTLHGQERALDVSASEAQSTRIAETVVERDVQTQSSSSSFALNDASQASVPPSASPRDFRLHGAETTLWNDPEFRQRFTESYLAVNEVEPRVTLEEREVVEKVATHIADERFDKAIDLLQKNRGPQSSAVFDFTLGNIYFQQENAEEAASAYGKAVEKFPRFRRAWKNLGMIEVRREEFRSAAHAMTRVIETGGGDALTYGLLGFAYSNTEKPIAAESAYRMASLLDPDTFDWKLGLARSFFNQRRYTDAASLCGDLIADQPESADLWLLQGNAFIGMGEPARAAENFEFVERLGKSTAASLYNLGDIYVNSEHFDLAVRAYVRAMEEGEENNVTRLVRAAKSITAHGGFAEVRDLMGAIQRIYADTLEPGERKDLLKLEARAAVAQGLDSDEAEILKEIVAIDPLDGEALILLGLHAGRVGEVEQAVFYFERAANIEGFEYEAKRRHGQLLVNQERYAEALPLLNRAQFLEPRDALKVYIEQVDRLAKTSKGQG